MFFTNHTQLKHSVPTTPSGLFWLLCTSFCLLVLTGCAKSPEQTATLAIHGSTMGTTYTVKWVDDNATHTEVGHESVQTVKDSVQNTIEKRLKSINGAMSTYQANSEILRFNATKPNVRFKASKDLYDTLSIAQGASKHTGGAFDATLAPLINLWGFGERGKVTKQPTAEMIAQTKAATGYEKLNLVENKNLVEKLAPVTINLSAVAKGYAVDALAATLEQHGIYNYMVEIGGEVFAKGKKHDGTPWVLGIEKPAVGEVLLQKTIHLDSLGLATSGDYRNYFEEGGIRYSHTIDPITGRPINHKLASVSVLRKTCAEADAYATALMVMGDERGVAFAKNHGISALFIIKTTDGFREVATGDFEVHTIKPAA